VIRAVDASAGNREEEPPPLVEYLRGVHGRMLDAVLAGDGLGPVAGLAAAAAEAPVAIVVPRLNIAVRSPDGPVDKLASYVKAKLADRPVPVPDAVIAEVPIGSGEEPAGAVLLLEDPKRRAAAHAAEFLHLAAVACLTEMAIEEAREEAEQNLRGTFLEELRGRPDLDPNELVRRAARLGCDISGGAMALCAELTAERPRLVIATIVDTCPGAIAEVLEGRVVAILPVLDGEPDATLASARKLSVRLERHGTVGLSSFYADPKDLARAVQEAELVLDVVSRSAVPLTDEAAGASTYRLLFRVLASHPEEVHSFYEDTVAPLVAYDLQYRTELVGTLEAYLDHNGSMNATAAAIYAHRHTVAYRLERIRELSGLDPGSSEDRERLGLGLKAYRIIQPRLPR
jgi:sugar diacid utilization regulator